MFRVFIILLLFPMLGYSNVYKIKKGESLWVIANKHKIPMSSLRKINDLSNDNLYVGQKIFIPQKIVDYTVKSEDTYEKIAKQFHTEIKYIVTLNNISEPQPIEGMTIKIPVSSEKKSEPSHTSVKTEKSAKTVTYYVKSGDTLSDIALKYKTTVAKLKQLNNKRSSFIYRGEKLIVGLQNISNNSSNTSSKLTYTVKRNDTLSDIALKYGVSQQSIRSWNNKRSSTLYVGEKLVIYTDKKAESDVNYRDITYIVKRGENLSFIAGKFKVSTRNIMSWNKKSSSRIYAGETLKIRIPKKIGEGDPAPKLDRMIMTTYRVKRGDTLDQIAINHGVTRSKLLEWNNKRNTRIYIGEKMKIYSPNTTIQSSSKKSKKAEYAHGSSTGVKSLGFKNVPLPVKASQILKTVSSGRGVEIELKNAEIIEAPADSKVTYVGYIHALQNVIILELPQNRSIVYAGLNNVRVNAGQTVAKGNKLGQVGKYLNQKNPTLYLELRENNKVANAMYAYSELRKKR